MVTKPELITRAFFDERGIPYELDKDLPGSPDLYLPEFNTAVFLHSCLFHQHGCGTYRTPLKWKQHLKENRLRDMRAKLALQRRKIKYLIVWECELLETLEAFCARKGLTGSVAKRETALAP